jgi:hypothetical protein
MRMAAALTMLFMPCVLGAQSTSRIGDAERDIMFETSIGFGRGAERSALRTLRAAARRHVDSSGAMGMRLELLYVSRSCSKTATPSVAGEWGCYVYHHQLQMNRLHSATAGMALVAFDYPIHVARSLAVVPLVGAGYVPLAKASGTVCSYKHSQYSCTNERTTQSTTGTAIAFGAALQWKRLVLEQRLFIHLDGTVQFFGGQNLVASLGVKL